MRRKYAVLGDVDWVLIAMYVILVSLGLSNIYAAVYDAEHPMIFNLETEYGKQLMWIGISLFFGGLLGIGLSWIFYKKERLLGVWIYRSITITGAFYNPNQWSPFLVWNRECRNSAF